LYIVSALLLFVVADEVAKESHKFQSDVSKMLDIIIHSLYTNRNIFLREVISNASDALDKIRFLYLTERKDPRSSTGDAPTMDIRISSDKEARTLTVKDGGVGMTKDDLINHLGSLGSSGTKRFVEKISEGADVNMIGQFGVGFYSVFLVADNVKVASKNDDDPVQWVWESTADGNFFVYEDPRGNTLGRGTELTLELKKDADEYLDPEKLKSIVKQYSEFIHFPIFVQISKDAPPVETLEEEEKDVPAEGEKPEEEDEKDELEEEFKRNYGWELVNENKPIWTRKTSEIEKEEYNKFFKALTKEAEDPLWYSHFSAEGEVEFKSILYIPNSAPHNLYDAQSSSNNVRLYVRRVFITDEFKDLLPRYLNFIRGVVDSDDLPLNVSRELLQESRILKIIKKKLVRKALSMIKEIADEDEKLAGKETEEEKADVEEESSEEISKKGKLEPQYPKFWEEFGKSLRLGMIEDSTNRARLTKLLRYKSSKSDDKYISLEDYVDRMPESQKNIFYIIGESIDKIKQSPLLEQATAEGVEVLYMTDAIDEYVVGHITEFSGKKLANLAKEGVKIKEETEKDKKIAEKRKQAWEPFLQWSKKVLGDRIEKATLSPRVATSPCVLVSTQYGLTANMERIMKGQALVDNSQQSNSAKRVFEVNPRHPLIDELRRKVKENDEDPVARDSLVLLYEVAALQSGFSLEDTNEFAKRMQKILKTGLNLDPEGGLVEEEEYEIDEIEEDKEEEEVEEEEDDDEPEEAENNDESSSRDEL